MLEKKKLRAELLRVQAAKAEMEYLMEQKMEEIRRLEDAVKKQELAESSLQEKIKDLGV
jgi:signal transduction histidine kinase